MLQSPPLANMLPFHHAAVHAAVHAAAAAQQQQQQQQQQHQHQQHQQHQQQHQHHQQETSPQPPQTSTPINQSESLFSPHPAAGLTHLLGGNGPGGIPQPPGSHLPPHMGGPHPPPQHGMPHPHHLHPGQFNPGAAHPHSHFGMEHFRPRFLFRMPRVVPNQKEKFESDDLMKRHAREGEVKNRQTILKFKNFYNYYKFTNWEKVS